MERNEWYAKNVAGLYISNDKVVIRSKTYHTSYFRKHAILRNMRNLAGKEYGTTDVFRRKKALKSFRKINSPGHREGDTPPMGFLEMAAEALGGSC